MKLLDLRVELSATLNSLHLPYKEVELVKGSSVVFEVALFGFVLCGLNPTDYLLVKDTLSRRYSGWRVKYVTTADQVWEHKNDIIWSLMRCGYLRYIRQNYKNQFNHLIIMSDFGKQIINKRLEIWGDKPKYKWLVEENKRALMESGTYVISMDPSFFDYMPEEN